MTEVRRSSTLVPRSKVVVSEVVQGEYEDNKVAGRDGSRAGRAPRCRYYYYHYYYHYYHYYYYHYYYYY